MSADTTHDAAAIAQDIERTQDQMGKTIEQIEDRLNPHDLARSLVSDHQADILREAWEVVRESPVPLALIAGGAAWLLATSQAGPVVRLRDDLRSRVRRAVGRFATSPADGSGEPKPAGPPPAVGAGYDRRRT